MTRTLRRRAAELGLTNLTVVDAGFLSYEHTAGPVDVVSTRNALHQLPDFWKVVTSTFTWLLEPMLRHAGFEILDRQVRGLVYAGYTCRRITPGDPSTSS